MRRTPDNENERIIYGARFAPADLCDPIMAAAGLRSTVQLPAPILFAPGGACYQKNAASQKGQPLARSQRSRGGG
jgi:hypothetical protein